MNPDHLHEWRLAERAAIAAEADVRNNIGKRNPQLRELKAKASRLRAEADSLLAGAVQPRDGMSPVGEAGKPGLGSHVAAWRRAEKRAEIAQEKLVAAFLQYVEAAGPLPPIQWETDVVMLRAESAARLERIYAEAKRLRSPSREDFRSSVPGSFGGSET